MLTLLRRFAVLAALMFWQGGFTFYAAVVVPVGQDVLGSHLDQGFITREVTFYLNISGAAALAILAWDLFSKNHGFRLFLTRWLCWVGMLGLLVALVWLHHHLEAFLDVEEHRLIRAPTFRTGHRWYLWLSTIQWGLSLAYAGLSLRGWQVEDRFDLQGDH
jgi:hypothetical protein